MKDIKKFKDSAKNIEDKKSNKKEKEVEVKFNAKSLEKEKDENPGFKSSVEDQEKVEKEFKKDKDKIEKFESFKEGRKDSTESVVRNLIRKGETILHVTSPYDTEDEFDSEYEESETNGCGCCNKCTGEPGCYCGCNNCKCETDDVVLPSKFFSDEVSESLKYHLDNNKPVTESIFRPGSKAFFQVIKEARELFDKNQITLCDIDKEIYESTEIGKFGFFNGELVPLDLPMENIFELNEAEYKGKKVKLNHPMRGGSKKYYVYVKTPKGNVKKISFGDTTGLTAKVSNPEARKSFAARHKCSTKKDKTKAGYWACRINKYGHLFGGKTYPGYW
jgi:hypothetical protein